MKRIVAYQVFKSELDTFDRNGKIFERYVDYGNDTALEEVLAMLFDRGDADWEYSAVQHNRIVATNKLSGEVDYIHIIGFIKSHQQMYHIRNRKDFKVPVMRNSEQDIMKKLESVYNISGYIKRLIRADIEKSRQIHNM
jgi:hypothetical protein